MCFTFEQERHEWNNRRLELANTNPISPVVAAWVNKALKLCVQLAELRRKFLPCKGKPTHSYVTQPHHNGKECIEVLIFLTAVNTYNTCIYYGTLIYLIVCKALLKPHMSLQSLARQIIIL